MSKYLNADSNPRCLALESRVAPPALLTGPPFPDDGPLSLSLVCHQELYASPLC